jgi:hypothetical protein
VLVFPVGRMNQQHRLAVSQSDVVARGTFCDRNVITQTLTITGANATWTNTIGAPELASVWTDPDFNPAERGFYYGRVIEIPTPRRPSHVAVGESQNPCFHCAILIGGPSRKGRGARPKAKAIDSVGGTWW